MLEMIRKVEKETEARQPCLLHFRILDTPVPGSAPSVDYQSVSRHVPPVRFHFLLDIIALRIVTFLTAGTLVLAIAGCAGSGSNPGEGDTISRDTFIRAYFELRMKGLRSPQMEISREDRDRVLNEVGVTEEELLTFVDLWGTDLEMMQGIWENVDSLMREARMADAEDDVYEEYLEEGEGRGNEGSGSGRPG